MDHKERAAQGQNGGTKNEEKDGGTPFAGRVGMILFFLLVSCALVLFVIAWCLLYCPEAVIHL